MLSATLHYLSLNLGSYFLDMTIVHLPLDIVLSILASPFTIMESEDHLLDFVLHWYTGNHH